MVKQFIPVFLFYMAFYYISNMNFIGYIRPFSRLSYTIPVYSNGENFFYHKLSQDFKIEAFEEAVIKATDVIHTSDMIPRLSANAFKIGDFGMVIFIDDKNFPTIGTVKEVETVIRTLANSYQSALKEISND